MLSDKTFLTLRTILGGNIDRSNRLEEVLLEKICLCTSSQEEYRLCAIFLEIFPIVKHRCNTYSTAYEKHFLSCLLHRRETIAKRKNQIKLVTHFELSQLMCAFTYFLDEKPKFITFPIHIINGDGTTEECVGTILYLHLHELSWQTFW